MPGELIGFVTCPAGKGPEIAHTVVSEKLVACVNIISSVRSVYLWQGKIEDDGEDLLVIKITNYLLGNADGLGNRDIRCQKGR